jgi:hypothetical protein
VAWIYLCIAGVLEVVWAYFMKQSAGFTKFGASAMTLIAMMASFGLLSLSMRSLPLGTAYTIGQESAPLAPLPSAFSHWGRWRRQRGLARPSSSSAGL